MAYHSLSDIRIHSERTQPGAWISEYVFWRPTATYLSWALVNLGATSVLVSTVNIGIVGAAAFLLFLNSDQALLVGAFLIQLYSLLDHVDGKLARFEMGCLGVANSRLGHYLDLFAHKISAIALFAIGWAVADMSGQEVYTLLGFFVAFFALGPAIEPAKDVILMAKRTEDTERAVGEIYGLGPGQYGDKAKSPLMRAALFVNELIGFPGWLVLLTIVCLLDVFLSPLQVAGTEFQYRGLLLIVLAAAYAAKFLFAFRWYMRIMASVRHD